MKETALRYAARGWFVLPIKARDKIPATAHGLLDASTDPEVIRNWFTNSDMNVGIRTGAISGIVVLDVDERHGGLDSLATLRLPDTAMVLTGGSGLHYFFRHPGQEIRNAAGILPGVDIRGDGGYVVAPPSIHASGRRYEWEVLHDEDHPLAEFPNLLPKPAAPAPAAALGTTIPSGQRNAELTSLAGSMRRRGMTAPEIYDALCSVNTRCIPPLGKRDIRVIAESVGRYSPQPRARRSAAGGWAKP